MLHGRWWKGNYRPTLLNSSGKLDHYAAKSDKDYELVKFMKGFTLMPQPYMSMHTIIYTATSTKGKANAVHLHTLHSHFNVYTMASHFF